MTVYFDASAFVKAYISEPQSDSIVALVNATPVAEIASSVVMYAEVRAALASGARDKRLSLSEHDLAVAKFDVTWSEMQKVVLDDGLARMAGQLARDFALRGFDAIHLASAIVLRDALGDDVTFAAFDSRLVEAAERCGLDRL